MLAAWAAAPLYLALVAALAAENYRREAAILRRGVYTDTFSPTLFLELLTMPGSWLVERGLPTYPFTDPFSTGAYMNVLSIRTRALVEVGLVQAGILFLIVLVGMGVLRRRQRR